MHTPVLETHRLRLRPFQQEDAETVFHCRESDPEVAKYMFWTSHNDIEKTKEWISFELNQIPKDDWYRFAILLKDTNDLIGTGLIYYEEEVKFWETGYNLGRKYWGNGYATEAMKEILSFAKNVYLTNATAALFLWKVNNTDSACKYRNPAAGPEWILHFSCCRVIT